MKTANMYTGAENIVAIVKRTIEQHPRMSDFAIAREIKLAGNFQQLSYREVEAIVRENR